MNELTRKYWVRFGVASLIDLIFIAFMIKEAEIEKDKEKNQSS